MFLFIDFRRFCSSLSVQMEKIHDTVRKSTLALRQRRRLLLSKLKLRPDFLRASFVERFCRCGKTNCRCNHGGNKHGPYYYLTQCLAVGKINKFLLKTFSQQQAAPSAIEHYRQFQNHLEEISQINAQLLRRDESLCDE